MDPELKNYITNKDISSNDKIKEVLKHKDLPNKNKIIQAIMCNKFDFDEKEEKPQDLKTITRCDIQVILDNYKDIYNCTHYNCNVSIFTSCCNKIYPCRQCHDLNEDHKLDRYKIDTIICKKCNTIQDKSNKCIKCNIEFAKYFCDICCLYQTNDDINIYHCDKCKVCRIGKREDYLHCDNCNMCLEKKNFDKHKCTEHFKNNCCICMEPLFDSTKTLHILNKCAHVFHVDCLKEHMKNDYKCPVCKKTIYEGNTENIWFEFKFINYLNPVPEEYKNWKVKIYCNDCEKFCETSYQITSLYECTNCKSFNTQQEDLIKNDNQDQTDENHQNEETNIESNSPDLNSLSDTNEELNDINLSDLSDEDN
jgi:hypothetical protein